MDISGFDVSTINGLVRTIIGLWFIPHAINIAKNFAPSAGFFDTVGFKPGKFFAALIAALEAAIGVCLILGIATQPVLVLAAIILVVAAGAVVKLNGPKWIWLGGGVEFPLMWAAICLALAWHA